MGCARRQEREAAHLQDRDEVAQALAACRGRTHGDVSLLQQRRDGLHLVAEELAGLDAEPGEGGRHGRVQLERQHGAARLPRWHALHVDHLRLVVVAALEVVQELGRGEGGGVEARRLVALCVYVAKSGHAAFVVICMQPAAFGSVATATSHKVRRSNKSCVQYVVRVHAIHVRGSMCDGRLRRPSQDRMQRSVMHGTGSAGRRYKT